jgi:hypothetical protein
MRIRFTQYIIFSILALNCHISAADVLYLGEGHLSAELQGMEVPQRWMTKAEVERLYGLPVSKSDPVGDPPISFWQYDHYVVYFEEDRVLHTLTNVTRRE